MKKQALRYRFHNPNPAEAAADHIVKVLLEANRKKAEQAIQAAGRPDRQGEGTRPV